MKETVDFSLVTTYSPCILLLARVGLCFGCLEASRGFLPHIIFQANLVPLAAVFLFWDAYVWGMSRYDASVGFCAPAVFGYVLNVTSTLMACLNAEALSELGALHCSTAQTFQNMIVDSVWAVASLCILFDSMGLLKIPCPFWVTLVAWNALLIAHTSTACHVMAPIEVYLRAAVYYVLGMCCFFYPSKFAGMDSSSQRNIPLFGLHVLMVQFAVAILSAMLITALTVYVFVMHADSVAISKRESSSEGDELSLVQQLRRAKENNNV